MYYLALANQASMGTPTRCSGSVLCRGAEAFGFDRLEKEAQSCSQSQVEKASKHMMICVIEGQRDQVLGKTCANCV